MAHVTRSLVRLVAAAGLVPALFGVGLSGPAGMTALAPVCAGAAYQHHATVVVTHLSGQRPPARVCVGFDEDHISGSDLLNRSLIQWQSDAYQGQGAAVCQVDYEPQPPPSNGCLGHNNDPYWSIWTASYGDTWAYAQRAITALLIHDGDAEGLRYEQPDGAGPPDAVGAICPPPAPLTHPPMAASSIPPARAPSTAPVRGTGAGGLAGGHPLPGVTPAPSAAPTWPPPDALQALAPTPATAAASGSQGKASGAEAAGRPVQVLGPVVAGVVGVILVGGLLAQLVLPRLRR